MAHLSILGTGNMGQAIAAIAGKGGHTVQLLNTTDADTQVSGDIVVLAVPYPSLGQIVAARGESLAGKIVVDITNPLDFETFDSLVVPADSSAAAEIAAALPASRVLKAFNTTFAGTLAAGTVGSLTTTVLIAEDHEDSRDALRTLLEAFGYGVHVAANGREAIERALAVQPDLILMDIMMPEVDGFEATRVLRATPGSRQVPIVAVTAMEGARDEVRAAGFDDLVTKPLDVRAFLDRVRAWTGTGRTAS